MLRRGRSGQSLVRRPRRWTCRRSRRTARPDRRRAAARREPAPARTSDLRSRAARRSRDRRSSSRRSSCAACTAASARSVSAIAARARRSREANGSSSAIGRSVSRPERQQTAELLGRRTRSRAARARGRRHAPRPAPARGAGRRTRPPALQPIDIAEIPRLAQRPIHRAHRFPRQRSVAARRRNVKCGDRSSADERAAREIRGDGSSTRSRAAAVGSAASGSASVV